MRVARFDSTPVCGKTVFETGPDQRPSAFNQNYTRDSAMPYGRQLRGLDGILDAKPNDAYYQDSWSGSDQAKINASHADDTVGNGIFDGLAAPPVQHAGNGVFEARYSEPGYLYRERLGRPSEVLDQTTGNPIIYHPNAGGSWHEDVLRTYRKWDVETPRYYSGPPYTQTAGLALGAEDEDKKTPAPSTQKSDMGQYAPYAIGGLLLGAAAAMLYKQYKKGELL
jgi:hypothetical protein